MTRVLHFSDVHLEDGFEGVPPHAFLNKRLVGLLNLRLNRASHFKDAAVKVKSLASFMTEQGIDFVLGTGDYTSLGTEAELAFARRMIDPLTRATQGFLTVPGNHDVYLPEQEPNGFSQHFGDLLGTDLPHLSIDGVWPQVRLIDEHLAVIGVNSARPNPQVLRSSGQIDPRQLEALKNIFDASELQGRFVIVATHYAPRLRGGKPDRPNHGLVNAEDFLDVCRTRPLGIIAHGHVHWRYAVREPGLALTLMNAGSATHHGREGLWIYEISKDNARAIPARWAGSNYELEPAETVELSA